MKAVRLMGAVGLLAAILVLAGCATFSYNGEVVKGKGVATLPEIAQADLRASQAEINRGHAQVLQAVAQGKVSPEKAAVLMEQIVPVAPNQWKGVGVPRWRNYYSSSLRAGYWEQEYLRWGRQGGRR